nr:hypothetical protein [Streptomyces sp. H23]
MDSAEGAFGLVIDYFTWCQYGSYLISYKECVSGQCSITARVGFQLTLLGNGKSGSREASFVGYLDNFRVIGVPAPEPRRTALLTAVVCQLEAQAVDDALGLFAVLMANRLISPARRASERERLAMLPQLEKAARILAKASKILTQELDRVAEHDADLDVAALWAAVEEAVPRTAVAVAVATVEALVSEDDGSAEAAMREKLALRYNTVRPFLALPGESDALSAARSGKRILKAVWRLPALSRRRVKERPLLLREVDAELVPAM